MPSGRVLAVDIGSTRTKLGLFFDGVLQQHWVDTQPPAELCRDLDCLVWASVHTEGERMFARWAGHLQPAQTVRITAHSNWPIASRYQNPLQAGVDRLLNALAAHNIARQACIVADIGTAVKVDAVGNDGAFLGGALFLGTAAHLEAFRARLPQLDISPDFGPPPLVGTSTSLCVHSGIVIGTAAAVEGLAQRMRRQLLDENAPLILTGGDAVSTAPFLATPYRLEPHLTLQGLVLMAARQMNAYQSTA